MSISNQERNRSIAKSKVDFQEFILQSKEFLTLFKLSTFCRIIIKHICDTVYHKVCEFKIFTD